MEDEDAVELLLLLPPPAPIATWNRQSGKAARAASLPRPGRTGPRAGALGGGGGCCGCRQRWRRSPEEVAQHCTGWAGSAKQRAFLAGRLRALLPSLRASLQRAGQAGPLHAGSGGGAAQPPLLLLDLRRQRKAGRLGGGGCCSCVAAVAAQLPCSPRGHSPCSSSADCPGREGERDGGRTAEAMQVGAAAGAALALAFRQGLLLLRRSLAALCRSTREVKAWILLLLF